ncbi:MAG: D-tyrosyl-tRNA(Tyr) deacylase [Syntrophorhabdus sp. PtaB.Bin027]|nr:MAG: D-tyrosyl-tRNA(Tyr) deacylase [Syntrophorhabdus sp. PtaB.Bin027]OQB76512.1 MAG: D-tyrosyl-tRNA(Tyr) deacylase [Deltaproteobacteria bacterium ADurb.Bin135]
MTGEISHGLLVFVGIGKNDGENDIDWMIDKIINLRIFEKEGKFDQSLLDVNGDLLLVSQFTLYGDCSKGRRPSFSNAMGVEKARDLFDAFVTKARKKVTKVETGVFQAHMDVKLINDGPVTLIIESNK